MGDCNLLQGVRLADYIDVTCVGTAPASDIIVATARTSRKISAGRRMTTERKRLADILMHDEPTTILLLARKVILEWLQHDTAGVQPPERHETLRMINARLLPAGHPQGSAGRIGGWLTCSAPKAVAPAGTRTIIQALKSLREHVGERRITVVGKMK